jgi:tetratricopeptide (TPR) repeat protein
MRPLALLIFAALPAAVLGQTNMPATDNFQKEALVFERSDTTIRMRADGTGERNEHVWLRLQSEGAARQFSVLFFSYAADTEKPNISLVRVHKPDGTTVETPAAEAIDMPAAVTREAPVYSDLKEKHLPVRALAVGDILEYEWHVAIDKAEDPGQFWGIQRFTAPGTLIVLSESLTLEVPQDKYVQVWSPNHKPTITEHDGVRAYRWQGSQLVPAPKSNGQGDDSTDATPPKDPDEDADGRKLPSVAWTTFHTWTEVGDWYRSLALERAQPTDALRARAAEITKDAKTPEEQARAIYTFVSTRTRYVGIDFGIGRYQPHFAAEVLANNYGDCKDKDTLLEALLRAKGFHTAPALIGVGITPVRDVPTPAVFNHVITTLDLPGGRIWLDSTPEVAPYRLLSASIRDQLALVVPAQGAAALERTPAGPPYPMSAHFEATGTLDAQGKFTSHVIASYRTDDEIGVRALARSVAPAQLDKMSQYVVSLTGFSGTTSNTSITNPEDLSSPIVLTYDYAMHPYGDWESRRIAPCFPAIEFGALASEHNAPPADIQLGAPRTLTAICKIRLPEGYRTDLPDAVHVKTDFATFDKTYHFDGKDLIVERTIVVLNDKLPKAEWKRYQAFTKDIGISGETWIQLIKPPADQPQLTRPTIARAKPPGEKPAQVVTAPVPAEDQTNSAAEGASAKELIQKAWEQMGARDLSGATATLNKAKAKDPQVEGLWQGYAIIAYDRRNHEEAIADYKKELAAHPDNRGAAMALGTMQGMDGDRAAGCGTLESYFVRHPDDAQVSLYLAGMQSGAQDYEGALKTLETAGRASPENHQIRARQSDVLRRLDRKDEAAAAARSALNDTDDLQAVNDAGFVLAEIGMDLPYAEEAMRKGIVALEAKTTAMTLSEVNSKAFAQTDVLLGSWDTLGWILFHEGKLDEAEPWLLAAWRNSLLPHRGNHLAQLYESMGKKQVALATYRLAAASIETNNAQSDVIEHVTKSIARLGGGSAKADQYKGKQALQETRTYHIARPAGLNGWGTFRLQLDTTGVVASQQMSGEEKLSAMTERIGSTKFPELVPAGSAAHLLRSGVLSCTMGATCDLLLVPNSSLATEQ